MSKTIITIYAELGVSVTGNLQRAGPTKYMT